jgi:hypothetical protein
MRISCSFYCTTADGLGQGSARGVGLFNVLTRPDKREVRGKRREEREECPQRVQQRAVFRVEVVSSRPLVARR